MLFNRQIATSVPMMKQNEQDPSVLKKESTYKAAMSEYHDQRRHAKLIDIDVGDRVLRPQKKSTVKTPFDPTPLTVVRKKGYMVTAETPKGKLVTRAANKFKKVHESDQFFNRRSMKQTYIDTDSDDDFPFCHHRNLNHPPLNEI